MQPLQRRFQFMAIMISCVVALSAATSLVQADAFSSHSLGMPRIVGGDPAEEGAYRWIVSLQLQSNSDHICGGALIADRWVMTAAHCLVRPDPNDPTIATETDPASLKVWIGGYDLTRPEEGVEAQIEQVFVHPQYDHIMMYNDIALIQLAQTMDYRIPHVALATPDVMQQAVMPGDIVNIAGWGDLTEDGESPDVLHEVQLPIVDQATCNAPTAYNGDIDESQLCAGLPEGGKDSCQGDSGGPLWVNYQGQDYLAGVVSYGEGCARPNKYGVYTRVERYDAWTQSILDGTDITPPMCEEVVEQEPNNLIHWQDAGTVSPESCLSISGEISTGYDNVNQPNPTADVDGFEFQVPVGAYLKVTFDGLDRTDHVSFGLFDLTYQLAVPMYCGQWQGTSMVCEATATSGWLAIGLSSRLAEDYTIDIQVEAGQKRSIFERLEDRMPHDSRTILEIAERLNN